ncbi:HEPN domain-containing protein (plasmid) [Burkholderia cenocepacia]|uniref:HEPN domain-containing protein n=1 Tax=Burkholderia cenocepacia TaxID=95486 RepID=UPI001F3089E2|nr:HEPN domain-containing protein [Burkholderia cenocepacia]UJH76946.1 HEPN domain-containing protein [Burkholderia cenocepacia]
MFDPMLPNREMFIQDPAGYSLSGWSRWAMLAAAHGADVDPTNAPSSDDLKSPILWLTQAEAMAQAAVTLVKQQPNFDNMPTELRGICDSQYCAVALMLVGYSLEVCLKAMIILRAGVAAYSEAERDHKHHELRRLANFIDDLSPKELATLELLTHFVYWAGRYPDPGQKGIGKHDKIFQISEENRITAHDLFEVAAKVMFHVKKLVGA